MSNLYKGAFVNREDEEPLVIDSNELFEKKLEEKRQRELLRNSIMRQDFAEESFDEGFQGLDADQLEQLTADQADIGGGDEDGAFAPADQEEAGGIDAEAELADIRAQAEQIINDAQAQAQEIMNNAAAQGHDEGYSAGQQEAMSRVAAIEAEYAQKEKELEENYRKLVEAAEPEMVEALTRIYEHIFAVQLQSDKNIILHLLNQALSRAEPTGDFLIHASSADYETIIDAKDELREAIANPNCNLEVVEDTFLKENECMIETDSGVFDCGLGTELGELAKKLKLLSWADRE